MDKGGDEESRDCIESSSSPSRSMGGCGDRALWVWPLRVDGEREGGKEEKEGWRCSDVGWPAREALRLTPDSAMAPCNYLSNESQCPSRRHASSVGAKGGGERRLFPTPCHPCARGGAEPSRECTYLHRELRDPWPRVC